MSGALLIVWTDISPESEAAFNDWYNHEHLPDRVGRMPGFLRGRRYVVTAVAESLIAGAPKYLTLYDLTDASLMLSPAHVALREVRPARDLQFVPMFRNTIKGICDVVGRCGSAGESEFLALLAVTAREPDFAARVAGELLPRLVAMPGVTNATVAMRNVVVTAASSAKDDRVGDRYADGLIVVEMANANAAPPVVQVLSGEALGKLGGMAQFVQAAVVLRRIYVLNAT